MKQFLIFKSRLTFVIIPVDIEFETNQVQSH